MIEAQVDGRPMRSSSRRLTSDASVKRDGGVVVWPFGVIEAIGIGDDAIRARKKAGLLARAADPKGVEDAATKMRGMEDFRFELERQFGVPRNSLGGVFDRKKHKIIQFQHRLLR